MKVYYIKDDKCKDLTPSIKLTKEQEKKLLKLGVSALCIYKTFGSSYLFAFDGISNGVQPVIDVLVDLAEPVSYAFMIKGCLEVITGKEHEGKKTIKSSVAGFLGVQFVPQIFKLIKTIKLN